MSYDFVGPSLPARFAPARHAMTGRGFMYDRLKDGYDSDDVASLDAPEAIACGAVLSSHRSITEWGDSYVWCTYFGFREFM